MDIYNKLIGTRLNIDITKIRGPYALLALFLVVVEALLGYWFFKADSMEERCIVGVIMLLILVAVLLVVKGITPTEPKVIAPPKVPEPTVEFCNTREDVEKNMTDLIKKTEQCLYYYGGAGFIGTHQHWQDELEKKLKSETIKFVRLIDLKTPTEIKEVLETMKNEEDVNRDITKYTDWLKVHSKYLKISSQLNEFYDFEGAPLWRYGVHHIIFDRKHVAIVFLSAGEVRNAIFVRNCPDIGEAMVSSIRWIVDIFNLTKITCEKLEELSGSGR